MMTEKEQLAWSSFMPALLACVGATKGPVLELGVGHFSTPALHALCGAMNRRLLSFEKDPDWYVKFVRFNEGSHSVFSETMPKDWIPARLSVSFIDDSPGGKNRADNFTDLLPVSDYVVVHDYEKDNEEAIAPLLKSVKFHHVTRTYDPPTLVASMTKPIPESILCL